MGANLLSLSRICMQGEIKCWILQNAVRTGWFLSEHFVDTAICHKDCDRQTLCGLPGAGVWLIAYWFDRLLGGAGEGPTVRVHIVLLLKFEERCCIVKNFFKELGTKPKPNGFQGSIFQNSASRNTFMNDILFPCFYGSSDKGANPPLLLPTMSYLKTCTPGYYFLLL